MVLGVAACSQAGPVETSPASSGADPAGLVLPDVEVLIATPLWWDSGIVEVFDDVALLAPEVAELRDEVVAHEARVGEDLLAQLEAADAVDEFALSSVTMPGVTIPGAGSIFGPPVPHGGGGVVTAVATGVSIDPSLGANLGIGMMAPELIRLTFLDQGVDWESLPVGEGGTDGKGQSWTKLDQNNAAVEMAKDHQVVENDTIVTTKFRLRLEGTMCPAADGNFDVRITVDQTVTATTRAGESWENQNVIVNAAGRLSEEAVPESYDVETSQTTTQKHADGRSGYTSSMKQRSDLNFREMDKDASEVLGQSGLTQSELDALTEQGDSRAVALAVGQMMGLFKHWLLGGCVQIKHDAPTSVDENSTVDIKIDTPHRVARSVAKSHITLTLAGDKSIEPAEFTSPGTFQYTSGDDGTQATIAIKATSRQGGDRASLTLEVSGERAYLVTGGNDGHILTEADNVMTCFLDTWGVMKPGGTATNMVAWTFDGGDAGFHVLQGDYLLARTGTWTLVADADGKPVGVTMAYSEGWEVVENASTRDMGAATGHFDLTPVPRPAECDAAR